MSKNPKVWQEIRTCYRKRSYGTVRTARKVAIKMYEEEPNPMYYYDCPHCSMIHITKKPNDNLLYPMGRELR